MSYECVTVVVYARSSLSATEWIPKMDNRSFELLWVRFGDRFLGALYHPPCPSYNTADLINFIDVCLTELSQYPHATIILAGDFNQLSDTDIVDCIYRINIYCFSAYPCCYIVILIGFMCLVQFIVLYVL